MANEEPRFAAEGDGFEWRGATAAQMFGSADPYGWAPRVAELGVGDSVTLGGGAVPVVRVRRIR